jgi:hypothetical protein
MNTVQKLFAPAIIAIAIFAPYVYYVLMYVFEYTKYSDIQYEQASVVQVTYVPESTSTGIGFVPTTDSQISLMVTSDTTPEQWIVVLHCEEHDKTFALKSKAFFERVKPDDTVTLGYVDELHYHLSKPDECWIVDQHTKNITINDKTTERK